MEDFIYILIGVLWLVFTFYTQNKKRKLKQAGQEKQSGGDDPRTKSILEELFGEMESANPPVEFTEPAPKTQPVFRRSTFENQYEDLGIQSIEKAGKDYYTEATPPPGKKTGPALSDTEIRDGIRSLHLEDNLLKERFDLRKALIYQAILDTPYL